MPRQGQLLICPKLLHRHCSFGRRSDFHEPSLCETIRQEETHNDSRALAGRSVNRDKCFGVTSYHLESGHRYSAFGRINLLTLGGAVLPLSALTNSG